MFSKIAVSTSRSQTELCIIDPIDLTRQLAAIQEQLLALDEDAFAERWDLRRKQDGLRKEAKRFAYAMYEDVFDDELLTQLFSLRARMKAIENQRIDLVSQSGSAGAGMSDLRSHNALKMNMTMDAAAGLPQIKERIGAIKGVLIDRGVYIPVPD